MNGQIYTRRRFIGEATLKVTLPLFAMTTVESLASVHEYTSPKKMTVGHQQKDKLGVALVGLGNYATDQLAPALEKTEHCYLAGIVTGSPEKAEDWKYKWDIPEKNIYNYSNFDDVVNNNDIKIIYVVLPNSMHKEYVVRAAKAGKHVICEKPMALTVEECDAMIDACKSANRLLSIGYRLHFEPHNLEMMRLGQQDVYGKIKSVKAEDGMSDVKGWRLSKELAGGGPLMDVGIYCVQGVRYTTGMEPIAVTAVEGPKHDMEKFKDIEESLTFTMEMPGGIPAQCKASYSEELNLLHAEADKGWFECEPAYEYKGIKGETSEGKMKKSKVNQQSRQMDDFALAIKESRPTPVPGEMGRQDVKILNAIYEAMRTGQRVTV
jgi:predicted dehydrogenase